MVPKRSRYQGYLVRASFSCLGHFPTIKSRFPFLFSFEKSLFIIEKTMKSWLELFLQVVQAKGWPEGWFSESDAIPYVVQVSKTGSSVVGIKPWTLKFDDLTRLQRPRSVNC